MTRDDVFDTEDLRLFAVVLTIFSDVSFVEASRYFPAMSFFYPGEEEPPASQEQTSVGLMQPMPDKSGTLLVYATEMDGSNGCIRRIVDINKGFDLAYNRLRKYSLNEHHGYRTLLGDRVSGKNLWIRMPLQDRPAYGLSILRTDKDGNVAEFQFIDEVQRFARYSTNCQKQCGGNRILTDDDIRAFVTFVDHTDVGCSFTFYGYTWTVKEKSPRRLTEEVPEEKCIYKAMIRITNLETGKVTYESCKLRLWEQQHTKYPWAGKDFLDLLGIFDIVFKHQWKVEVLGNARNNTALRNLKEKARLDWMAKQVRDNGGRLDSMVASLDDVLHAHRLNSRSDKVAETAWDDEDNFEELDIATQKQQQKAMMLEALPFTTPDYCAKVYELVSNSRWFPLKALDVNFAENNGPDNTELKHMGDSHIVAPNGQGVLKCELKLLQMILTECNLNHTLADQADRNKSDVYIINTVPYNMHQANVDVFEGFLKDVHRFGGPYIYADDVDFQRDTQEIFDLLDPECQRRMFQFIIPLSFPFCDDSDRKDEDGKIVKNVSLTFPHFPEKGKFHWFFPFRVGPNDPEKLVLLEWAKPGFLKDHPVMLKMALEGDRVRSIDRRICQFHHIQSMESGHGTTPWGPEQNVTLTNPLREIAKDVYGIEYPPPLGVLDSLPVPRKRLPEISALDSFSKKQRDHESSSRRVSIDGASAVVGVSDESGIDNDMDLSGSPSASSSSSSSDKRPRIVIPQWKIEACELFCTNRSSGAVLLHDQKGDGSSSAMEMSSSHEEPSSSEPAAAVEQPRIVIPQLKPWENFEIISLDGKFHHGGAWL